MVQKNVVKSLRVAVEVVRVLLGRRQEVDQIGQIRIDEIALASVTWEAGAGVPMIVPIEST